MRVTITGATGFIGRRLVSSLLAAGQEAFVLSRNAKSDFGDGVWVAAWDPMREDPPAEALKDSDVLVHLAGEPVAQRWSAEVKRRIHESRIVSTRRLVQAMSTMSRRPKALVCASAIGIYGSRGDTVLTETSAPGRGFLPEVCIDWEREASLAEGLGMRVVKLRTGVVLGSNGGALVKMLPPFKAGVGGKLASGRQWMSWIHVDDLVGLLRHAIGTEVSGPMNATAPNPVINAAFTRSLAGALHRPAIFPVPGFAVRALFGEMAEIVLASQRVLPKVAEASGYKFRYPELDEALRQILV